MLANYDIFRMKNLANSDLTTPRLEEGSKNQNKISQEQMKMEPIQTISILRKANKQSLYPNYRFTIPPVEAEKLKVGRQYCLTITEMK